MGLPVGGGGTVVKDVGGTLCLAFDTLGENVFFPPEFFDLLFFLNKIQVGGYAVIHCAVLLPKIINAFTPKIG
jgi:hypothetical protein